MSIPKLLAAFTFLLFAGIALVGWWKSQSTIHLEQPVAVNTPIEIPLQQTIRVVEAQPVQLPSPPTIQNEEEPEDVDRVEELFRTSGKKSPIVETVVYKSHVNWNKGKQAWLSDYASHFHTSRHFIARSRNGKPDYLKQDLAEGDRFNVLRNDIPLQFNLVIDVARSKMWLYYLNQETGEKEVIKSYNVGLGRPSPESTSGLLTPLGQYQLGDRIVTFKPGTFSIHNGAKTEMIRIFGTRWIPFAKEIGPSAASWRGLGIHGVPWKENEHGELVEDTSSLGHYQSDGCIRLATKDIEELYAIIITKPTVVEIVPSFHEASFPHAENPAVAKKE